MKIAATAPHPARVARHPLHRERASHSNHPAFSPPAGRGGNRAAVGEGLFSCPMVSRRLMASSLSMTLSFFQQPVGGVSLRLRDAPLLRSRFFVRFDKVFLFMKGYLDTGES